MNYTTNYQLPQWVKEDRIMMEDFNDMTAKVDEALGTQGETIDLLEKALEDAGNCKVWTTSYVGNGKSGQESPNTLVYPTAPKIVFIFGNSDMGVFFGGSQTYAAIRSTSTQYGTVTWSEGGRKAEWYASHPNNQVNANGITYLVVAFS